MAPALEAVGLGRQYRSGWALRGCDFTVPAGRICGAVGPNGAGKSTLLALAAHQLAPTEGELRVLGEASDGPELRARVAYVAQDKPLYPGLTVAETLRMGRELNPHWDEETAQGIVDQGELQPRARIGSLSGGQRTRVSLALALGKLPDLLLLDEPMADLDPLARHQLMGTLMATAAERGTTIVLSSHILPELDGVIDHLLLVQRGRIRLAGDLEEILDGHRLLTGPAEAAGLPAEQVVEQRVAGRRATALVRTEEPPDGPWESERPNLEDLLLGYLRAPADPRPDAAPTSGRHRTEEAAA
ncbi:ABC-2 type transport system ATP-binding protein [Streptomyces sp. 1114.5]|uniref:ATP-binding cassette domain-containing protein n=1 Tax=Streptomyces sp. 1114.5 TaxID=1938830 RepID=UPI000EB3A3E3|nr:ABC transporter ATP-binding protein [Streptomyces sp. 1114.5]RKT20106.1 ABC-2 type transport system ATP-binding protein [Streptomyces sp. 1114.5]